MVLFSFVIFQHNQKFLVTSLLLGYIKPRMLRIRLLHEVLWKQSRSQMEGWKMPKSIKKISQKRKLAKSDTPFLVPKERNPSETLSSVHLTILLQLTLASYIHVTF